MNDTPNRITQIIGKKEAPEKENLTFDEAFTELTPKSQRALIEVYVNGKTREELAEEHLGRTPLKHEVNNTNTVVRYAERRLHELLKPDAVPDNLADAIRDYTQRNPRHAGDYLVEAINRLSRNDRESLAIRCYYKDEEPTKKMAVAALFELGRVWGVNDRSTEWEEAWKDPRVQELLFNICCDLNILGWARKVEASSVSFSSPRNR